VTGRTRHWGHTGIIIGHPGGGLWETIQKKKGQRKYAQGNLDASELKKKKKTTTTSGSGKSPLTKRGGYRSKKLWETCQGWIMQRHLEKKKKTTEEGERDMGGGMNQRFVERNPRQTSRGKKGGKMLAGDEEGFRQKRNEGGGGGKHGCVVSEG